MKRMSYRVTFTEELLGTASANPELMREFIASKRPDGVDEAEIAALPPVDDELAKSMTVFSRDGDKPILWDYQIKGAFKDACSALSRVGDKKNAGGSASSKLTAFKKVIDGLIFVEPRKIVLHLPAGKKIGICERPLRAQTAQGERIALARSETVPADTWIEFDVLLLDAKHESLVTEWMDYGQLRGFGQWRNSGKGRYRYEELDAKKPTRPLKTQSAVLLEV